MAGANAANPQGDGSRTLQQALGNAPDSRVDPERATELASMLVEMAATLDQVAWSTWKIVNPNSPLKRGAPAKATMARFVAGDAEVTRERVRSELERLRQMLAALTAAVGQTGRVYAQKHVDRFAPGEIERSAKMSAGASGMLVGHEVKCWRKYVELAGPLDAQAIERELLGAMSAYAESLLKGLNK